jgi:hypothetical protein
VIPAPDAAGAHALCRDCGASFLPDAPAQRRCLPCVRVLQTDQLGRRREEPRLKRTRPVRYLTRLFRRLRRCQPPPSYRPELPQLSARSFDEVIGHLADAYPEQRRRIFADADEIRPIVLPRREPDTEGGSR